MPDAVHAVVPVADTDERQAVRAHGAGPAKRAQAVLVDRRRLLRHRGQVVDLVLVRLERTHLDERDDLVEHARVARHAHVVIDDERQPHEVIREARASTATGVRVPPVLYVAFDELSRLRRAGCARAQAPGRGRRTPCSPGAGRGIRRRRSTDRMPERAHMRHASAWYSDHRFTIASNAGSGVRTVIVVRRRCQSAMVASMASAAAPGAPNRRINPRASSAPRAAPSSTMISRVSLGATMREDWSAAHGSSAAPVVSASDAPSATPAGSRRSPFRPMNSRRSAVWLASGSLIQLNATRSANDGSKKLRGEDRARLPFERGADLVLRVLAHDAQRPLDEARERQRRRCRAAIRQAQSGDLDRRVRGDADRELARDRGRANARTS